MDRADPADTRSQVVDVGFQAHFHLIEKVKGIKHLQEKVDIYSDVCPYISRVYFQD
jgi:hypothetical protein